MCAHTCDRNREPSPDLCLHFMTVSPLWMFYSSRPLSLFGMERHPTHSRLPLRVAIFSLTLNPPFSLLWGLNITTVLSRIFTHLVINDLFSTRIRTHPWSDEDHCRPSLSLALVKRWHQRCSNRWVELKQGKVDAAWFALNGQRSCCGDSIRNKEDLILCARIKMWDSSGVEPNGSLSEGGWRSWGHIRISSLASQFWILLFLRFFSRSLLSRGWLWFWWISVNLCSGFPEEQGLPFLWWGHPDRPLANDGRTLFWIALQVLLLLLVYHFLFPFISLVLCVICLLQKLWMSLNVRALQ